MTIMLPSATGGWVAHDPHPPITWQTLPNFSTSRHVYAAAHVVADPRSDTSPGAPARLNWDATLQYRHHLWDLGLGVADAMDTAQRNFGLDWPTTRELIRRTGSEAASRGVTQLVCGISTDHLEAAPTTLDDVENAYLDQLQVTEDAEITPVLMASRHLAALAHGPEDYARVYGTVISRASSPVVLHWLGTAFDPMLTGYWGASDIDAAMQHLLAIVHDHADRIDGVKLSLLEAQYEIDMRRLLPDGVRMYCGDDFNYPAMIRGDAQGHSHALLGIFDAIAPIASAALCALDAGDEDEFSRRLEDTVPLSRHVFAAPTYHYKTGITFLAWLAGHQDAFSMVGGMASARGALHLVETYRLGDALGLFPDPDVALARLRTFLAVAGLDR